MKQTGPLHKMNTVDGETVAYSLKLEDKPFSMNDLIGAEISLEYQGKILCIECGKRTRTSFAQGMCYPCFQNSPRASECIIRPELCRGHLGEGRDVAWEKKHHVQPHIVYLALSSSVKVGVTRDTQVPTRFIDQGATAARIFAVTPNRFEAGVLEVELKKFMTDKTNWRKMLKNEVIDVQELAVMAEKAKALVPENSKKFICSSEENINIHYPVNTYPEKITSLNFDKQNKISGTLNGIKGQYLLLSENRVLNIRKFAGYVVSIET